MAWARRGIGLAPRSNKYFAKRSVYDGRLYHSGKEARYAAELDLKKRAGLIKDWRRQVPVVMIVNGVRITKYVVDYVVTELDDTETWIEVKGHWTETATIKARLFRALFPERRYEVV